MRTKTSTVDVPRRDFCRNQVNETTVWIKAFGFLSFVVAVAASPKHSVFARKLTRCRSGVVVLLALRHYCSILLYRRGLFIRSNWYLVQVLRVIVAFQVQPDVKTLGDPVL